MTKFPEERSVVTL